MIAARTWARVITSLYGVTLLVLYLTDVTDRISLLHGGGNNSYFSPHVPLTTCFELLPSLASFIYLFHTYSVPYDIKVPSDA
jgi:hypothetical protein